MVVVIKEHQDLIDRYNAARSKVDPNFTPISDQILFDGIMDRFEQQTVLPAEEAELAFTIAKIPPEKKADYEATAVQIAATIEAAKKQAFIDKKAAADAAIVKK